MNLEKEFVEYLINLNLKDASVKKYSQQVPVFIKSITDKDIYNIFSLEDLSIFFEKIKKNKEFIAVNQRGNSMYSAGINHYYNFFEGRVTQNFDNAVSFSIRDSRENRLNRLSKYSSKAVSQEVKTTVYLRNPDVVAERLYLANGYCEDCGNKAPFNRKTDSSPYLEVHHIIPLSENGSDDIENTVALCPNCHRKRHFG